DARNLPRIARKILKSLQLCASHRKGLQISREARKLRKSRGFLAFWWVFLSRFGTVRSQVQILSPRLFLEMSPSASTSKGFSIVRTRVTDRRACSNGIARWSNSPGEVTELLCLLGETCFKSRRLF